jgi:hypothetical protein
MALAEPQIVRYSRQILLASVGGEGQERLLSTGASLVGQGSAQATAAAYLAAGGTPIVAGDRPLTRDEVGFLFRAGQCGKPLSQALETSLRDSHPDALQCPRCRGTLAELPACFSGAAPWVAIGHLGASAVVVHRDEAGCEACFQLTVAALDSVDRQEGTPAGQALSVLSGAVAALTFQRVVLGLETEHLGAVTLEVDGRIAPRAVQRCPEHGRP